MMMPAVALLIFFIASTFTSRVEARQPRISETVFDGAPTNLFYFEDSDIVILTDEKTKSVYRSLNAGGSWELVKSIPKDAVNVVVSHPFDKCTAVAVGKTMHWITEDCGDSWRSFLTEDEISILDRRQPVEFHASDSKKMLFHTARCNMFGCEDHKVRAS